MTSRRTPLLAVNTLTVTYPLHPTNQEGAGRLRAVHGVSFELRAGQVFGLVGESGSGKTTIARAIVGLVKPGGGSIHYRGEDVFSSRAEQRQRVQREIQYLFQDPMASLSPRRSILKSLIEPLQHYRIGVAAEHHDRIRNVLKKVDLPTDVLNRFPHELSGGQRQRLALARALLAEPLLLIADEPMSSLDVSVQARMINLFRKVQEDSGLALLIISHDLAVVRQLADSVGVLYAGELVESGPADDIFLAPAHPYTQTLLACASGQNTDARLPLASADQDDAPLAAKHSHCAFHKRCPKVMQQCKIERPPDREIQRGISGKPESQGIHITRCHLWN